jgi:mevalonate kinase
MSVPEHQRLTAPGKLLLFGEHAAVYGYPALGVPLSRKLSLVVEPSSRLEMIFADLPVPAEMVESFVGHLKTTGEACGLAVPAARLTVSSDIPVGGGFGSSAALCTVLAGWLLGVPELAGAPGPVGAHGSGGAAVEDSAALHAIWRLAHRLEHFFHGTPSGIDTGLTTFAGPLSFHFSGTGTPGEQGLPTVAPVQMPPAVLVAGSIPRTRSTRELVASVRERRERDPRGTDAILRNLGTLSEGFIGDTGGSAPRRRSTPSARSTPSTSDLGTAADQAHRLLTELGVSTPQLDAVLQRGIEAGALGGKLSGAGGGGAFFLVCSDDAVARDVVSAVGRHLDDAGTALTIRV